MLDDEVRVSQLAWTEKGGSLIPASHLLTLPTFQSDALAFFRANMSRASGWNKAR